MTRVAESMPTHCAACYGQYPDRRYVDFEASYDGPIVKGGVMGDDGKIRDTIPVSIDELVICEDCLRPAARLLGMEDLDKVQATLSRLQDENVNLRSKLAEEVAHNRDLTAAVASKPTRQKAAA